jgi:hypothetical protein
MTNPRQRFSMPLLPLPSALRSPRPPIVLITTVMFVVFAPSAVAQLGETADTCAQHYGPVVQKVPSVIQGGDATAQLHRRNDLDITIHFKNGRAWHIAYAKAFLSDGEKAALLAENGGPAKWRRPLGDRIGNVMIWITENNSIVVSAFEVPNLMLVEVMTRACADELARLRDQRILAAQRGPTAPVPQPEK